MFARGFLCFYPALFPYPNFNRAPSALSRLCHSFVFSRLRTLSFLIPPLSPVSAIVCALFPKKPGVHPPAWSYQVSSVLAKGCRLAANGCLLSPFFPLHTRSRLVSLLVPLHTQKQGGVYPLENVGAPTFLIFPHIFRTFSPHGPIACPPQPQRRRVDSRPPFRKKEVTIAR
jgi:hypothetical protein